MQKTWRSSGKLALAVIVGLLVGLWLGGHPSVLPRAVQDVFVERTPGRVFDQAIDLIEDDYYRKVDQDQLLNAGLKGAMASLHDRFSLYFDPKTYSEYQQDASGQSQFQGVGVIIKRVPQGLRVLSVMPTSPAQKAGIKRGAIITAVDGHRVKEESSAKTFKRLKGKIGTTVTFTVLFKGQERNIKLKRVNIAVPQLTSNIQTAKNGTKVSYVRLYAFNSGSGEKVRTVIKKSIDNGAKAVILDLRNNPGGFINEAVDVASIFINKGKIVTTKGRAVASQTYDAAGNAINSKIPVVVLVDRNTASAAEIVSGALQDYHRAKVIGEDTFGKGVFGFVPTLSNGGAIDIVLGEYYTPKGRNLGGGGVRKGAGIIPDIRATDSAKTGVDEALQTAIKTVSANNR